MRVEGHQYIQERENVEHEHEGTDAGVVLSCVAPHARQAAREIGWRLEQAAGAQKQKSRKNEDDCESRGERMRVDGVWALRETGRRLYGGWGR